MIVAHQGGPGREGRNESKTEIRQGLGNSTRPQLFCLPQSCHTQKPGVDGYATSEIAGKILITKFPKFLEETKKERRKEEKEKKWKKRRKRRGSFETRRECVFMNTWKELVFSDEEKGHIQGKYY